MSGEIAIRPNTADHRQRLLNLRKRLGLTQSQMAERLGIKLRGYQDLEGGQTPTKLTYVLAAERVALEEAVNRGDANLAPPNIAFLCGELARMRA